MKKLTVVTVALLKLSVACSPSAYHAKPPTFQQWQPGDEQPMTATLVMADQQPGRGSHDSPPNAYPGVFPVTAQPIDGQLCYGLDTSDRQTMASCDQLAFETCDALGVDLGLSVHENVIGDQIECVLDMPQGGDCWDIQVSDAPGYAWRGYCVVPILWGDVAN